MGCRTNSRSLGLILSLALAGTSLAHAGGVSDGGGGTTNPNPANADRIVWTASSSASLALISWLNAEQGNFRRLSSDDQAASPFKKLFAPTRDIFDVIRETSIEVRMSRPCFDANGVAWDGSIYPTSQNAICISPFTMAPKLTEMNFDVETVALIAHELSHLLGTTEDEARAIQRAAIYALGHVDLIDLAVKYDLLAGTPQINPGQLDQMDFEISTLADFAHTFDSSDRAMEKLVDLRTALRFDFLKTQAVREKTLDAFQAQYIRLRQIQFGGCFLSTEESSRIVTYCRQQMDAAFAGARSATAQEISNRNSSIWVPGGADVIIQRPDSDLALKGEVSALRAFLKTVLDEVKSVQASHFNLIRMN